MQYNMGCAPLLYRAASIRFRSRPASDRRQEHRHYQVDPSRCAVMCSAVICCDVLWYAVLCCVVLCCVVLGMLCCAVLCCAVVLCYLVLCYVVLCCVVLLRLLVLLFCVLMQNNGVFSLPLRFDNELKENLLEQEKAEYRVRNCSSVLSSHTFCAAVQSHVLCCCAITRHPTFFLKKSNRTE